MERLPTIDINDLELNSIDHPYSLVVPGYYSVDKTPITIHKIGHVMKMIPSAKLPRKLRIIGSDGRNYKYLLKGREDLRLDQRIVQLFSLANSILHDDKNGLEKHLNIKQVPIVPISPNAGLIVWAEGGETLYSMISWHRKVLGIIENEEQQIIRDYIGNNQIYGEKEATLRLSIIQKLELHREVCSCHSDDDIRETIWLQSQNAEIWLNKVTNFSKSNGLMSIIGYIMGIGDRHPSNILVMKGTGNVIHIDFSDCFEKANLRAYVHETVPFRLTRMIVRAFGASGVNGVFSMTAEYVMKLMRKNKDVLLAFLDIFVKDPITDTIWYRNSEKRNEEKGTMMKKAISRVSDKLCGVEFGMKLNEKEQVKKLIEMATDEMNLAQMYYGWAPFW
ncbi:PIKK family atypical protein kinase [Histomonas meleagridis]|uniref:PIKK family atypical protein kinase n=1 Tax=Histomonas meleagridis TaxID=135588 RepID=UPI00355A0616|nr:PIKK family atypical protein kinase [Histomonas meleagridis]KAH0804412.1 PIKK family atypical protein kinase [Histomonas meleagridis]